MIFLTFSVFYYYNFKIWERLSHFCPEPLATMPDFNIILPSKPCIVKEEGSRESMR